MSTNEAEQLDAPASPDTSETPGEYAHSSGRKQRKTRVGAVVSDKSDKTVTVMIKRRVAHPFYGKRMTRTKKYHAHDEKNEYQVGDLVRIAETRPLSKTKRWRVIELVERPD
jgi:small subunit ribosomal protein S17